MKKIIFLFVVLCVSSSPVLAKDNFFLLRQENCYLENGDHVFGTYNVFENNTLEKWAPGFKIITGEKGFKIVSPTLYYKLFGHFHIGTKYSSDSLGNNSWAPSFRFKGPLFNGKIFAIADFGCYIDYKGGDDRPEFWLNLVQTGQGWYYGGELWTYKVGNADTTCHYRPVKIGYRFENGLAPYVMGELKHLGGKRVSTSVYTALEISF